MIESHNGESPSRPRTLAPKRHTAKHCPFAIRERIVNALANGDSKRAIARSLRVSNNTVTAVAEQEWQRVEARKARIAAQTERIATRAADRINAKLESGDDIPISSLVPVFDVAVDKLAILRSDGFPLHIDHTHTHGITDDDILAFALARSKQIKTTALDVPALPPGDPSVSGENAAQKEG